LNDLDITYFNKTIETVRSIQPDDLQKLANQYLQPEDFYDISRVLVTLILKESTNFHPYNKPTISYLGRFINIFQTLNN